MNEAQAKITGKSAGAFMLALMLIMSVISQLPLFSFADGQGRTEKYGLTEAAALAEPCESGGISGVSYESVIKEIPYPSTRLASYNIPYGAERLVSAGALGSALYRYRILTAENGAVIRTLVGCTVLDEPVAEVVHFGDNHGLPYASFAFPSKGELSSLFGYRELDGVRAFHHGIDIANEKGTPVYASSCGKVVSVTGNGSGAYGNYVVIEHENGYSTCYAHLSSVLVKEGKLVAEGELIGKTGSTGNSTGNHLHFEIRLNGERKDPLLFLDSVIITAE